jgi:hypothetical protein
MARNIHEKILGVMNEMIEISVAIAQSTEDGHSKISQWQFADQCNEEMRGIIARVRGELPEDVPLQNGEVFAQCVAHCAELVQPKYGPRSQDNAPGSLTTDERR